MWALVLLEMVRYYLGLSDGSGLDNLANAEGGGLLSALDVIVPVNIEE